MNGCRLHAVDESCVSSNEVDLTAEQSCHHPADDSGSVQEEVDIALVHWDILEGSEDSHPDLAVCGSIPVAEEGLERLENQAEADGHSVEQGEDKVHKAEQTGQKIQSNTAPTQGMLFRFLNRASEGYFLCTKKKGGI